MSLDDIPEDVFKFAVAPCLNVEDLCRCMSLARWVRRALMDAPQWERALDVLRVDEHET